MCGDGYDRLCASNNHLEQFLSITVVSVKSERIKTSEYSSRGLLHISVSSLEYFNSSLLCVGSEGVTSSK